MSGTGGREVHELLTTWADAHRPAPSAALQQFTGPAPRIPRATHAAATRSPLHLVTRAGLGLKIVVASSAFAMTGAAAVGISHVVTERPPSPSKVVVPAHPSTPATTAPGTQHSRSASADPSRPTVSHAPVLASTAPGPRPGRTTDGHRPTGPAGPTVTDEPSGRETAPTPTATSEPTEHSTSEPTTDAPRETATPGSAPNQTRTDQSPAADS